MELGPEKSSTEEGMKKYLKALVLCVAVLLISVFALSYDYSPGAKAYVPKAIWSQTAMGGEWFTEIMIHDINGGAVVQLDFIHGPNQARGTFTIWDNSNGGPAVFKSPNILKDLQDHYEPGFNYYNKVGGLFIFTQDDSHPIHVSAKSYHSNNYSETYNAFPASLGEYPRSGYSVWLGEPMKLMNMVQGSNLRSNIVVYNPFTNPVTVQFKVIGYRFLENCGLQPFAPPSGHAAVQYGSTFTKTFGSVDYQVFNPFSEAGCETTGLCKSPFPATQPYQYWCYIEITVTSGVGSVIVLGATAYNDTNDPAATIPVPMDSSFSYDYSPGSKAIVPKAIWSQTATGGEWFTEIMIHDINGGAVVNVVFDYGPGLSRGSFIIWDNTGGGPAVYKSTNILKDLQDHFDTGFNYYNRVGGLYIHSQSESYPIHVSAKSYHSNNYSETYNAFPTSSYQNPRDGYSAELGRPMKLMNMVQGSNLRSNVVIYNPGTDFVMVQFKVIGYRFLENCGLIPWPPPPPSGHTAVQYGVTFTKVFSGIDYQVFNPFAQAVCEATGTCNWPVPATQPYQYWCYVEITPIGGTGHILVLGATAYNDTNDPAATIPVQIN